MTSNAAPSDQWKHTVPRLQPFFSGSGRTYHYFVPQMTQTKSAESALAAKWLPTHCTRTTYKAPADAAQCGHAAWVYMQTKVATTVHSDGWAQNGLCAQMVLCTLVGLCAPLVRKTVVGPSTVLCALRALGTLHLWLCGSNELGSSNRHYTPNGLCSLQGLSAPTGLHNRALGILSSMQLHPNAHLLESSRVTHRLHPLANGATPAFTVGQHSTVGYRAVGARRSCV